MFDNLECLKIWCLSDLICARLKENLTNYNKCFSEQAIII